MGQKHTCTTEISQATIFACHFICANRN